MNAKAADVSPRNDYALNTRLNPEDWDFITQKAYNTYVDFASQGVDFGSLGEREQNAWREAVVKAVTVALGGLPKPEHVTA